MTDDQGPTADRPEELHPTPLPSADDLRIDEASDESFPASDPPAYPAVSSSRSTRDESRDADEERRG